MKKIKDSEYIELLEIIEEVRRKMKKGEYEGCKEMMNNALQKYPHAPEPHNLYGLVLEGQGEHVLAMKHFRAAWALDPTYLPARYNLNSYGSFGNTNKGAFIEEDCPKLEECNLSKY